MMDQPNDAGLIESIEHVGYGLIEAAIELPIIESTLDQFISVSNSREQHESQLQNSRGANYGARNVLDWFPPALEIWRTEKILDVLADTLGNGCGLVRGLFFDKPPTRSWAVPWHKDMTIAVHQHLEIQLHSPYSKPTTKAGVAHVEAPEELLAEMLTLRIHLDPVTTENGPLKVVPGSHKEGKRNAPNQSKANQSKANQSKARMGKAKMGGGDLSDNIETILANAGDVLAIRPLVSHSSAESSSDCADHRRILHLEFAAHSKLTDGWHWKWFDPVF